jgi:putative ABC transport system permease protein
VLRATLRSLLARKLRLLLSGMAVVLGISFVSGAFVLTDTMGRVFDDLFVSVGAKTDVEVRGTSLFEGDGGTTRAPVPASVLDAVREVEGVEAATGDVFGYAQLVGKDGKAYSTNGPPTFGQNYDDDPRVSPYTLRQGEAPAGAGEVAIDARTAEQTGYAVGDEVPVLLPTGQQSFTLSGVFGFGETDNLGGASIAAFEQETAEALFAPDGDLASVRVAAQAGVDPAELRERVADVLPADVEALTGTESSAEQADEVKGFFGFFQTFLLVFAGIALFVGAFLIFNTFSILVAQRSRELALLRALGASRRQVTASVLVEAVVVGLVASLIGLGLGVVVAKGLQALINSFGGALPSGALVIAPRTVVVSVVTGVVVTLLAALLPARRAARVPPVAAMRETAAPERSHRLGTGIGVVLVAAGGAALAIGLEGEIALVGVGALASFLGVAALSPLLSRPVSRVLGAPLARRVPGRLGRLNAMRNPRRTATTAAALMIGMALVTAVGVLGASAKASVEKVVEDSVGAEVFVQATGFQGFPATVADVLQETPGVASADRVRQDQAQVGNRTTFVTAIAPEAIGRGVLLSAVAGDLGGLSPGRVLLSESTAQDQGLSPGDGLELQLAKGGPRTVTVAGVYEDNELVGPVLLDLESAESFASATDVAVLVSGAPGTDTAALVAAAEAATADFPTAEVLDRSAFIADTADDIDVVLSIITVLLALSVIIAVLGIVNTLALAVLERTRELGLLRAVGLSRRQTRRMIMVESVIVAVFGALLGIAVGSVFGVALQRALADEGLSELRFPVSRLVLFLAVAALAGVLAALLPARRAARLDVLRAIATA